MSRLDARTIPLTTRSNLVARLTRAVSEALNRRRERQLLSRLDDHLLRDIGLAPDDARSEAAKPFWQG